MSVSGWNFKIIFAENGREAVEQASRHLPDVITLDMKMPEMDGYQAIEILRRNERLRNIPVIAVTALALKHDEEVLTKLCNGYLRKLVSRTDLVRELMKHLPHTVVETIQEDGHLQEITSTKMIFPPSDEVKRLIRAAEMGSVTALRKCIADIKAMGCNINPLLIKLNHEPKTSILTRSLSS